MDSVHLRTLRMVSARPQDVLPCLKGTGGDAQGGHAEYMLMKAAATYLIPDRFLTRKPHRSFAPGIPFIAGSAGPIRSRRSRGGTWNRRALPPRGAIPEGCRLRGRRDFALPRQG